MSIGARLGVIAFTSVFATARAARADDEARCAIASADPIACLRELAANASTSDPANAVRLSVKLGDLGEAAATLLRLANASNTTDARWNAVVLLDDATAACLPPIALDEHARADAWRLCEQRFVPVFTALSHDRGRDDAVTIALHALRGRLAWHSGDTARADRELVAAERAWADRLGDHARVESLACPRPRPLRSCRTESGGMAGGTSSRPSPFGSMTESAAEMESPTYESPTYRDWRAARGSEVVDRVRALVREALDTRLVVEARGGCGTIPTFRGTTDMEYARWMQRYLYPRLVSVIGWLGTVGSQRFVSAAGSREPRDQFAAAQISLATLEFAIEVSNWPIAPSRRANMERFDVYDFQRRDDQIAPIRAMAESGFSACIRSHADPLLTQFCAHQLETISARPYPADLPLDMTPFTDDLRAGLVAAYRLHFADLPLVRLDGSAPFVLDPRAPGVAVRTP